MTGEKLTAARAPVDWVAFSCAIALSLLGLVTMDSLSAQNPFFVRQIIWIVLGVGVFFAARGADWRFLRRSGVAASLYALACALLFSLFIVGHVVKGAQSWFNFGLFAFEPAELANLALIVVLAKYFSRRHIEIANIRHVLVSGFYALVLFVVVALQPDFGGSLIIFCVWLGMILVSGISRKHLFAVAALGIVAFSCLWQFGFHDYQRQRIMTFLHPLADVRGSGYNAFQSMIAVGSGELLGKGIGYGTQSKLRFLPEYQTDFMFAAFSEEWGFIGIILVFALYGVLFWRLLVAAGKGATNFETLFTLGVLFYLAAHFMLHVGINMGLLPVTGTTVPFMSYGGSHILVEYLALGMVAGMGAYARAAHRDQLNREFSGGYDR